MEAVSISVGTDLESDKNIIATSAFQDCTKLKEVQVMFGAKGEPRIRCNKMFQGCNNLSSAHISAMNDVCDGYYMFDQCHNLELMKGVVGFLYNLIDGRYMFWNCFKMSENLDFTGTDCIWENLVDGSNMFGGAAYNGDFIVNYDDINATRYKRGMKIRFYSSSKMSNLKSGWNMFPRDT